MPSLKTSHLIAAVGLLATLATAPAGAAIAELAVVPNVNAIGQYVVNVSFDRDVCRGPARSRVQAELQPPADAVVQSRLDGNTVSVVIKPGAGATGCPTTRTWQIALPELKAGNYSVRVAEAVDTIAASGNCCVITYNRNVVGARVASLTVVAPEPAPVLLYMLENGYLVAFDGAAFSLVNSLASNNPNRWQPAFYGWLFTAGDVPPRNLVELVALNYTGPDGVKHPYYTIDPAERGYLLSTGYFSAAADTARYYVVAPTGGACAEGRPAIYRAFDSATVRHRYVPANTYRTLVENGWKGEGIAFCAGQPVAADDWTPN